MGNITCNSTGKILTSSAMAKYMSLTKEQILSIRDTVFPLAANSKHGVIKRESFNMALDKACVKLYPDQEVLHLFFTLWDLTGNIDNVNCKELCVGISFFACANETSFDGVLAFAMNVLDYNKTGMISLKQANLLLQSTYCTKEKSFRCMDITPILNSLCTFQYIFSKV
jgi:Ca2+-binding EF-hand superfamily protein